MTYDQWKTRSPYDEPEWQSQEDYEADACEHEEYEADIIDGRAYCDRCGHSWWLSTAEIEAEITRLRRHDEWETRQRRPWNRLLEYFRSKWTRWRLHRRWKIEDDGIPF